MVEAYRGFDKAFKYLFDNATEVSATALYNSGIKIGTITIDGQTLNFYIPSSGGSIVSYNEGLQSGTLVGTLTIDGVLHNLYCTAVEANPLESATGTLTKLGINGTVYEIQGGSGHTLYLSDYYDTTERVVGRWLNGKPLYQKTFTIYQTLDLTDNTWYETDISITNLDEIINTNASETTGNSSPKLWAGNVNGHIGILSSRTVRFSSGIVLTIQYTKTTDAAGTGPTPGNIIYLPAIYSEEEHEVGVWLDGKPLYQRTIQGNSQITTAGNEVQIAHNISDIDKVIDFWGGLSFTTSGTYQQNRNQDPLYFAPYQVDTTYTRWKIGSTWAGSSGTSSRYRITIQYTKTTDQPGSGTWTPEGQFSHHYSLSEQIIGTWVDGNTLYEISVPTGGSAPTGATVIDRISKTGYDVIQYTK